MVRVPSWGLAWLVNDEDENDRLSSMFVPGGGSGSSPDVQNSRKRDARRRAENGREEEGSVSSGSSRVREVPEHVSSSSPLRE